MYKKTFFDMKRNQFLLKRKNYAQCYVVRKLAYPGFLTKMFFFFLMVGGGGGGCFFFLFLFFFFFFGGGGGGGGDFFILCLPIPQLMLHIKLSLHIN